MSELNDLFTLDKAVEQVEWVLSKELGVTDIPRDINVSLLLDYSVSMEDYYSSGHIATLLKRLLGIANTIDDDGIMELVLFEHTAYHYGPLTAEQFNSADRIVADILSRYEMGGTSYSPAIQRILDVLNKNQMKEVSFFNRLKNLFYRAEPSEIKGKQLLIMITDGFNNCSDEGHLSNIIKALDLTDNIYLQFITLNCQSSSLQSIADYSPSVGYTNIESLDKVTNEDLIRSVINTELLNKFEMKA